MDRYLGSSTRLLPRRGDNHPLFLITSGGELARCAETAQFPFGSHPVWSDPARAGGRDPGAALARQCSLDKVLSFDGGTTAKNP